MAPDTFDTLGPAESFAVKQLHGGIVAAITETRRLLTSLEEIDLDEIEAAMLDADRKKGLIEVVEPMQKLSGNLSMSSLVVLIANALIKPKATV